ncbi:hypothetical protein [Acaryochloris sp. IP29b_bin.137]|uniref:hypothetical protein n=1 Tax=Acaryochloris sp. IP29b_bin.137 TaxID=2969217 RepID=UPI00262557AD|nr:hypothetical protein [Acaryochloris sp. IP29b_bin.137]
MKAQRLLPLCSALFLGLAAAPAFAGSSSVSNSWNIRDIKGGYSSTSVNVTDNYSYWREAGSDAIKKERGVNIVKDYNKGGPSLYEKDVYNITAKSWTYEKGDGHSTTTVNVNEHYYFDGLDKTHTVTSGYSF